MERLNTQRAVEAFEASLAAGSSTPDYGAEDREAFLNGQRDVLRGLAIQPAVVIARPSGWAKAHGEFREASYEMIAVAGTGVRWLLFDPTSGMFSLAEGSLDGELELIGFRSKDALAEWNG